jgi:hypothetical protein
VRHSLQLYNITVVRTYLTPYNFITLLLYRTYLTPYNFIKLLLYRTYLTAVIL